MKLFKKAIKLILYWSGSEQDREDVAIVNEQLVECIKHGATEEKKMAQHLLEELWKVEESSLC